jgi:hypothetical protein
MIAEIANAPINFWGRRCLPLSPTFSTQPNGASQAAKLRTGNGGVNIGKTAGGISSSQVRRARQKEAKKNNRADPLHWSYKVNVVHRLF